MTSVGKNRVLIATVGGVLVTFWLLVGTLLIGAEGSFRTKWPAAVATGLAASCGLLVIISRDLSNRQTPSSRRIIMRGWLGWGPWLGAPSFYIWAILPGTENPARYGVPTLIFWLLGGPAIEWGGAQGVRIWDWMRTTWNAT